jgi:sulfite reductase (NADPH) hemoprotein beta-component
VIETYKRQRTRGERFIDNVARIGTAPYRAATDAVRRSTARHETATA